MARARTPIEDLIASTAPARPACFHDDAQWKSWLESAHESGIRIVRRIDEHQRTPNRRTHYEMLPTREINYCGECLVGRQRRMQEQGKCHPCYEFANHELDFEAQAS